MAGTSTDPLGSFEIYLETTKFSGMICSCSDVPFKLHQYPTHIPVHPAHIGHIAVQPWPIAGVNLEEQNKS